MLHVLDSRRWWMIFLLAGLACAQDSAANGDAGGTSVTRAAGDTGTPSVAVVVGSLDAGADGSADSGTARLADSATSTDAGALETIPGSMQVGCGSVVCKNPFAMVGNSLKLAEPCCLDAAASRCGWVTSDVCMPPPPLDMRCPTLTVPSLLPTLPPMPADPCCTSTGRCGIALPQTSLGCFETTSFPGGTVAPMNCDGTPIVSAADVDAGA